MNRSLSARPQSIGTLAQPAFYALALALINPVRVRPDVLFNTGSPDGRIATASRPSSGGTLEIESADDFLLTAPASITAATFTGLLPVGASLGSISQVDVEIYRVFPKDSTTPPNGAVPTRVNSPSDVEFASRDSAANTLTFTGLVLNPTFSAANSILNGINPSPNQSSGGEGPVRGQEVELSVTFATPFDLPADHYFFGPQVKLSTGEDFYWLSAAKPISGAGTTPFNPDLQTWVRNGNLDPNWLRVGTDIVGGTPAPTFNASFTLFGTVPDVGSTFGLLASAGLMVGLLQRKRNARP